MAHPEMAKAEVTSSEMNRPAISHADMDRKLDEHFRFEAQDDVEGVLATLTHDAEHDIVGSPTGPTHGREAACLRWESCNHAIVYQRLAEAVGVTTHR